MKEIKPLFEKFFILRAISVICIVFAAIFVAKLR